MKPLEEGGGGESDDDDDDGAEVVEIEKEEVGVGVGVGVEGPKSARSRSIRWSMPCRDMSSSTSRSMPSRWWVRMKLRRGM